MKYICLVILMFISSIAIAEDDSKEITRADILKMMKTNLDYSYKSHVDIPYDLYGENKHVNRRLSIKGSSKN